MKIGLAGPITLSLLSESLAGLPSLPSGFAFAQSAHLANELVNRGHEVAIFALDPELATAVTYRGDGWEVHVAPYRKVARDRAKDLFRVERKSLVHAMRLADCDIIHANWSYEFAWAALASDTPTLTTFHDWAPAIMRLNPDRYRAMRLLMAIRTIASRTSFTAVSPYIAVRIRRYTRTLPLVIPNFVSGEWFARDCPANIRSAAMLLAVNNGWEDRKNVAALIRAMPQVRTEFPEATLILVGTGYEPGGAAANWARVRSFDRGLEFRGLLSSSEIADLMSRATVFVHPSREESFGIVLIEAMASGLPVIAGHRSGGVPWVLDNGRAGALVNVRDSGALGAVIVALLGNPDRRAELARKGLENVRKRFSIESVTDGYLAEYSALAGAAPLRDRRL